MADYQLISPDQSGPVQRAADGVCIPADPANRDWEIYQQWVDDGGVPDPYKPPLDVEPLNIRTAAQILGVEE